MTTDTAAPLTTPRALAALQDAIREEVRRELIEKLTSELEGMLGAEDVGYLDGFRDAITTLEG